MKIKRRCMCGCGSTTKPGNKYIHGHNTVGNTHRQTHGLRYKTEYFSWREMISRCYYKRHKSYDNYGGRGIQVCIRWRRSVLAFFRDMGPRPKGTTLDRIDNNGHYKPENCKWSTRSEQQRNKRNVKLYYYKGKKRCMTELSEMSEVCRDAIRRRIKSGLLIEDAVERPFQQGSSLL